MVVMVPSGNLKEWLTIFHLLLLDCDLDLNLLICNYKIHDCISGVRLQYSN